MHGQGCALLPGKHAWLWVCVWFLGGEWLWGGMCGCWGVCMVARGCMVVGGMHGCRGLCGCQGACVIVGGIHGCRGVCMVAGGCAWLPGVMCGCLEGRAWLPGGVWLWGGGMHRIRLDTVNERAVRILLECILVDIYFCNIFAFKFQFYFDHPCSVNIKPMNSA